MHSITLLGESQAMRFVLSEARIYATVAVPLLILGEQGTGKTALARYIHEGSGRPGAFVSQSAQDIPDSLAQATIRGHAAGSFTGADRDQAGIVEMANRGTLFLDELGDASPLVQGMLRTLLDGPVVRRIGDSREIRLDVRFIMATNVDLEEAVRNGRFRDDLKGRFRYRTILMPPLRERDGDIVLLARHFLRDNLLPGGMLDRQVHECFLDHSWPGNIRELELACEHARMRAGSNPVQLQHLPIELLGGAVTTQPASSHERSQGRDRRSARERLPEALRILSVTDGNKAKAAKMMKVSRQYFYRILSYSKEGMSLGAA